MKQFIIYLLNIIERYLINILEFFLKYTHMILSTYNNNPKTVKNLPKTSKNCLNAQKSVHRI